MTLATLTGRASGLSRGSDYSYAASSNGNGPVAIKNQLVSARLDGVPMIFKSRTLVSIDDGDVLAAAGATRNGTFEAVALRNLTSGASYHPPTVGPMVLAALLIAAGLPLIALLGLGLLFVGFGAYVMWKCLQVRKAVALLKNVDHPALRQAMHVPPAAGR
jgi:hypothetical protein